MYVPVPTHVPALSNLFADFLADQTPPKRELKVSDTAVRDLSLSRLGLAPSSILHLQFLEDSLNRPSFPSKYSI